MTANLLGYIGGVLLLAGGTFWAGVYVGRRCFPTLYRPIDVYCGHCRRGIREDPVLEIIQEHKSYLVYRCNKCGKETCLGV